MGYPMQPARVPGGGVFSVLAPDTTAAQTFIRGAVLVFASGKVSEASTGVTTNVAGVALQGAFTGPGNAMANSPAPITWQETQTSMAVADSVTIFEATFVNGSTTRIAPAVTDIGVSYGVSKYTDWAVDKSLTAGSAAVRVVGIDTQRNLVFFKWLAAAVVGA